MLLFLAAHMLLGLALGGMFRFVVVVGMSVVVALEGAIVASWLGFAPWPYAGILAVVAVQAGYALSAVLILRNTPKSKRPEHVPPMSQLSPRD